MRLMGVSDLEDGMESVGKLGEKELEENVCILDDKIKMKFKRKIGKYGIQTAEIHLSKSWEEAEQSKDQPNQ